MPTLKQTLAELRGERTLYALALEYAKLKDGTIPKRRDRYLRTVEGILEHPETAQYENLKRVFTILGVDIEVAIIVAASQAKPR